MLVKAELKNYRQSPRKVRLVADLVRGKKVKVALAELSFLNKKASPIVKKLVDSAIANAKNNFNLDEENLVIKEIRVDEGPTLKRWTAGARGRAFPLKKRTSRVLLSLESIGELKEKKEKIEKKAESKDKKPKKEVAKKEKAPKKDKKSEKK